jgi:hypothetical protein
VAPVPPPLGRISRTGGGGTRGAATGRAAAAGLVSVGMSE